MEFKEKLLNYRAKHNLTQTELAKILKVAKVTVLLWENGKQTPTRKNEVRINQILEG